MIKYQHLFQDQMSNFRTFQGLIFRSPKIRTFQNQWKPWTTLYKHFSKNTMGCNIISQSVSVNCNRHVFETDAFCDSWSESVTDGGFKCSGNASIACCQQNKHHPTQHKTKQTVHLLIIQLLKKDAAFYHHSIKVFTDSTLNCF